MNTDLLGEQALLELCRLERETLDRWVEVLIVANQFEHAEKLRKDIETELARAA